MPKRRDMFEEHACAFKNEGEVEEELEEDLVTLDEVESEHFEDEDF
ncbi:MAG: hypothetical protein WC781_02190 [Candidatus Pacearchaeota archaeon]